MPPSGQQGLDRLQQGGIDVIALDQYMPGLDGLETLERISWRSRMRRRWCSSPPRRIPASPSPR
jgi:CheY-like chemotaxis protein